MKIPTFGRADYDPNEIAKDGPFRAPRKWLHVQKVLIGVTVYAVYAAILGRHLTLWAAVSVGPGILLAVMFKERLPPTDPTRHTAEEHLTDFICDGSLYSVGAVLYLIQFGPWYAAPMVAGALFALYRMFRNGARP